MSRVQLALRVSDLAAAVSFYGTLFQTPPALVRPGYARFAVDDPPLKLVLLETPEGEAGVLDHLGVEVDGAEAVEAAASRLASEGLVTEREDRVACCYALQDKVWARGPDGEPWEVYVVLGEASAGPRRSTDATAAPGATGTCCEAAGEVVGG
jgi:catechol 2,3-dioxygenase-like lactoylglutathione lyase family enzyme